MPQIKVLLLLYLFLSIFVFLTGKYQIQSAKINLLISHVNQASEFINVAGNCSNISKIHVFAKVFNTYYDSRYHCNMCLQSSVLEVMEKRFFLIAGAKVALYIDTKKIFYNI